MSLSNDLETVKICFIHRINVTLNHRYETIKTKINSDYHYKKTMFSKTNVNHHIRKYLFMFTSLEFSNHGKADNEHPTIDIEEP
jgi:hypothetical protein